ncbi:hypothetical protein [Lujinxingia vulgaris]|uniref:hypothetical protein n=1 Tax=Lujinxingia vulgaris TaxID=2600176 RepID=UPI001E63B19E|nr:hypothetical protein [Lujinxingia vulgaris]
MYKFVLIFCAVLALSACTEDAQPNTSPDPDTGAPDTEAPDTEAPDTDTSDADADAPDADADAPDADCIQVEASPNFAVNFADGASIEYWTDASPQVEGQARKLSLLFERYMEASYEGTFELGPETANANFGNCPHCVFMRGDTAATAYFADRGTIVSNTDVFSRRLDIAVTNLRLIEVSVDPETRESTPIEDGTCIEVADFTRQGVYPPDEWTCLAEVYDSGEFCDCECGAYDPDCATIPDCLPGMPGCEPVEELPVAGCEEAEVCVVEPISQSTACVETCNWSADEGCAAGTCVFDFGTGNGDICIDDPERFAADTAIGEDCPSDSGLQLVCAVEAGFARGYCDYDNVCRPVCADDSECTVERETCIKFADPAGLGFCGVDPFAG